MDNKEFGIELENRTIMFAIRIIKLSASLPNTPEALVIRNQITKSGTSVGANYREANRSRSQKDFANKIGISESECNETVYWLKIVEAIEWVQAEKLRLIINEASELLAIFTSIKSKLRSK